MAILEILTLLVVISICLAIISIALTLYFIRSVKRAFKEVEDRIVLVQDTSEESALQISEFSDEMSRDLSLVREKVGV